MCPVSLVGLLVMLLGLSGGFPVEVFPVHPRFRDFILTFSFTNFVTVLISFLRILVLQFVRFSYHNHTYDTFQFGCYSNLCFENLN